MNESGESIFAAIRGDDHPPYTTAVTVSRPPFSSQINLPPHSLEAERSVLGCMLLDASGTDAGVKLIDSAHFYSVLHQQIFSVARDLHNANIGVDIVTMSQALADRRVMDDETEAGMVLLSMLETVPHSASISHYANIVKEKWQRRSILTSVRLTLAKLEDPSTDAAELLSDAVGTLQTVADRLTQESQPQFAVMTSAELDAADLRIEYLVDGVLAARQPCIIAASKKSLKTTVSIDLALSLASGAKFLNEFYVKRPVRVALMSGESGDATIQETARRIARSKPWINLSEYANAIWSFDLPRLGQPKTKAELTKFIRDNAIEVLIIDPAYLCLDLDENAGNLFSVGKKLIELTEIGHATGCTMILVHHNKKSTLDQFGPPELESIAWSGFQEWARQWILLGRREAYNPENAGSHKLWLSVGGSAGHSGRWALDAEEGSYTDAGGRHWAVSIQGASSAIAETIDQLESEKQQRAQQKIDRRVSDDAEKLMNAYRRHPDGQTARHIRDVLAFDNKRFVPANERLTVAGMIESCEIKKNNRSFQAFRPTTIGMTGMNRDSTGMEKLIPVLSSEWDETPIGGHPTPNHNDRSKPMSVSHPTSIPVDSNRSDYF